MLRLYLAAAEKSPRLHCSFMCEIPRCCSTRGISYYSSQHWSAGPGPVPAMPAILLTLEQRFSTCWLTPKGPQQS